METSLPKTPVQEIGKVQFDYENTLHLPPPQAIQPVMSMPVCKVEN
jgi:hypothetical protein